MPMRCLNWMSSDRHTLVTLLLDEWLLVVFITLMQETTIIKSTSDLPDFPHSLICWSIWHVLEVANVKETHACIMGCCCKTIRRMGRRVIMKPYRIRWSKKLRRIWVWFNVQWATLILSSASCILKLTRLGQSGSYTSPHYRQNRHEVRSAHVFFGRRIWLIKFQQMRSRLAHKCYSISRLPCIVCCESSKISTFLYNKERRNDIDSTRNHQPQSDSPSS